MSNFIDSNLILRYVLDDPKAEVAKGLLKSKKRFYLLDVVVAEIVWVLKSFYKWEKEDIIRIMISLLKLDNIAGNKDLLLQSFEIFRDCNVDYIDAYMAAVSFKEKPSTIYSLDKDFGKIPDLNWVEPE